MLLYILQNPFKITKVLGRYTGFKRELVFRVYNITTIITLLEPQPHF